MARATEKKRLVNALLYALCSESEEEVLAWIKERYRPEEIFNRHLFKQDKEL